jgi:hypothetical protein
MFKKPYKNLYKTENISILWDNGRIMRKREPAKVLKDDVLNFTSNLSWY